MRGMKKLFAVLMCAALLCGGSLAAAEQTDGYNAEDWFTFLLLCNEGSRNDGGNVGNTQMVFSVNASEGVIKQMLFSWKTFVEYEGYDSLQLIDQPFRMGGPEETLSVFNANLETDISSFMSVNYLNLASIIDHFGGVYVDLSRADRNAVNGMVASKNRIGQDTLEDLGVDAQSFSSIFSSYQLVDYGPSTHLSGIQAVAYGWLQYDSIVNCCIREVEVISQLFFQVRNFVNARVALYTGDDPIPATDGRRAVNLDAMSEADEEYLYQLVSPIFTGTFHNFTQEQIMQLVEAILRTYYNADASGSNAFDTIQLQLLPAEIYDEYQVINGVEGIVMDKALNAQIVNMFLYDPDYAPTTITYQPPEPDEEAPEEETESEP